MYVLHGSMYENLELIPQNYKAYIKEWLISYKIHTSIN
jgi:hypothetical protein